MILNLQQHASLQSYLIANSEVVFSGVVIVYVISSMMLMYHMHIMAKKYDS